MHPPGPPATDGARDLLWGAAPVFERRHEKTAAGLVAIHHALARAPELDAAERDFLATYEQLVADAGVFARVWREPSAYYWTVVAYDLLGFRLSGRPLGFLATAYAREVAGGNPRAALPVALTDAKRFALSAAILSGREVRFGKPLVTTVPFAIPGALIALRGMGDVAIRGVSRDHLDVSAGGSRHMVHVRGGNVGDPGEGTSASAAPLACVACPVARCDGWELPLEPAALRLPGLDLVPVLASLDPAYQERHASWVGAALDVIRRHDPRSFRAITANVRVAALKPRGAGDFTNLSHSALPGAFVLSVVHEPFVLAGAIIHELHHNRLFAVEEEGEFFERDPGVARGQEAFYSPWRDDLRPVQGIFHGLYVYVAVARFWLAAYRSGELEGERRAYAEDQLVRIPLQLAIGVAQIERYARLTPFGMSLFAVMRDDVVQLRRELAGAGLPSDPPARTVRDDGRFTDETVDGRASTVHAIVRDHARRFSPDAIAI